MERCIRNLEMADLASVRMKAEAIAADYYPELIPSIDREHALLSMMFQDSSHYARCVGPRESPEAVLIAHCSDNLWALHRHATILLWYSAKPGAGYILLTDFVRWVREQKRMVLAGFMDDFGMDERMDGLLRRAGFVKRGCAHCLFPRGTKK